MILFMDRRKIIHTTKIKRRQNKCPSLSLLRKIVKELDTKTQEEFFMLLRD